MAKNEISYSSHCIYPENVSWADHKYLTNALTAVEHNRRGLLFARSLKMTPPVFKEETSCKKNDIPSLTCLKETYLPCTIVKMPPEFVRYFVKA